MDRTNWKIGKTNVNILVIGIVYEGLAFTILFKMMDKFGNSNFAERKLVALVFIAFIWCYKVGIYVDQLEQKIKIKKHGYRAKSLFKYGLDYIFSILLNPQNQSIVCVFEFLSCT